MATEAGSARAAVDACPGVLRPHHAADGELLRLRVPGGALTPAALRALAAAAAEFADGTIGLTSRGNMQVRGVAVADVAALTGQLAIAGLAPAAAFAGHERVRNLIASPLSGRLPGAGADIDPLVEQFDRALCARPALTQLPGRFLFALDDGIGDVAAESPDVLAIAVGEDCFAVRPAGCETGVRVPAEQVLDVMLAVAELFLIERREQATPAWRVSELSGAGAGLLFRLLALGYPAEVRSERTSTPGTVEAGLVQAGLVQAGLVQAGLVEAGLVEQQDGRFAVCAVVGLGLLDVEQALALAASADLSSSPSDMALRITPWRRAVIRDLELPAALAARELLDAAGLIVTPESPWSRITACAGRPGCAKSLTDVHADARAYAVAADPVGPAVHWAGCERGCGTPSGQVVRVFAGPEGYRLHEGHLLSPRDRTKVQSLVTTIETEPAR